MNANRITLVRIFLVPIAVFFLLAKLEYGHLIAAVFFIIAASTDGLDGYIARKRKQVTNLGKLLDPLADKLLVSAVLIALVATGDLPAWIAIIIISREFIVTGLRAVAASEGVVIAASKWGKIKTVTQIVAISGLMLRSLAFLDVLLLPRILLYVAVVATIISGIDYIIKADKILHIRRDL